MAVLLALLSAVSYGASDFFGGIGGRRGDPYVVALVAQVLAVCVAGLAVIGLGARSPSAGALAWGALAGIGSALGTIALYSGFASGQMSVVAPLSGVLTAAIPAVVGLLLGEHLGAVTLAGIALAVPAVILVSLNPEGGRGGQVRSAGVVEGLLAGLGFALILIALDRAGSHFGAWPLIPCDGLATVVTGLVIVLPLHRHRLGHWRPSLPPAVLAGVLGGASTVLYLFAAGKGQLSVVAVLTALYPASTVVLARLALHEEWSRLQATGLVAAVAAVAMISLG